MIRAIGVRAFALTRGDAHFDQGMISSDDDGITRVYINASADATPEKALAAAVATASTETYRQWTTSYKLVTHE